MAVLGTQEIEVPVTQTHIDQGEEGSARSCPIALAVFELFPDVASVLVDEDEVTIITKREDGSAWWSYNHDHRDWIGDFDESPLLVGETTVTLDLCKEEDE